MADLSGYLTEKTTACIEPDCRKVFTFVGKCRRYCDDCKKRKNHQRMQFSCEQRKKRTRELNNGVPLTGKDDKSLAKRLAPLVQMSYAECGEVLGISAEAVRQIELRVLEKLRVALDPYRKTRQDVPESLPRLVQKQQPPGFDPRWPDAKPLSGRRIVEKPATADLSETDESLKVGSNE